MRHRTSGESSPPGTSTWASWCVNNPSNQSPSCISTLSTPPTAGAPSRSTGRFVRRSKNPPPKRYPANGEISVVCARATAGSHTSKTTAMRRTVRIMAALFEGERHVHQPSLALDLQCHRRTRLERLHPLPQRRQRRGLLGVDAADDVARQQGHVAAGSRGTRGHHDAVIIPEALRAGGELWIDLDADDAKLLDEVVLRIDRERHAVELASLFDRVDADHLLFRAREDRDLDGLV